MTSTMTITPQCARRVAISAQCLDGPKANADRKSMLDVFYQIRCLQMDPIRAVERTQYLVLWSRLGPYEREIFHNLVYREKLLFEYWAHAASFVLVEDFPLHEYMMRNYGQRGSAWSTRLTNWVQENQSFCDYILGEIERRGPLLTQDFDDKSTVPWASSGWTAGRSVSYMIDYLWSCGRLMVAQREGLRRWWDLAGRVLPAWTPAGGWSAEKVTVDAAQKALRALGIAQIKHIQRHFTEGRYPRLDTVLQQLLRSGVVQKIRVKGWDGEWYIHRETMPLVEKIEAGHWKPRTVLLSPFDNLIRDRERTEQMWNFYYRIEIYVPKEKRQYGYYVLPILHGDRLVGRIDPHMNAKTGILTINNLYLEPDVRRSKRLALGTVRSIKSLARFLHAGHIDCGPEVPSEFRNQI